ncbi:hypothetical protein HYH03_013326 [Edaphochlamys debaryana]|uniref:Uncharacterized protein n=1 Tax=Edaphochlamys debaryana TaxID=47281 RepID=A0A836BTC2_9CHLO|nr:hypothetical protein HYH03_013326 [Edaphochlamys debaryana]|eukprot:KAG2488185.1 hypothetical protein HYH03_013326 [Edaphochlamys debaryana]
MRAALRCAPSSKPAAASSAFPCHAGRPAPELSRLLPSAPRIVTARSAQGAQPGPAAPAGGDREPSRQQPPPASGRPADFAAAQAIAQAQLDALLAREAEVVLLRQQLDEQRRLWAEQQALVGDRLDRIASRREALAQQLGAQLTASMQHTASLEEQMGRAAERQEAAAQELGLGLTGAVWEQHEQAAADRAREMEQLRRELTAAVAKAVAEAVAGQRREGWEALQLQLAGAVEEQLTQAGRHQRGVAEELGRMAEQVDRQRDLIAGLLAGLPPKREGEAAASTLDSPSSGLPQPEPLEAEELSEAERGEEAERERQDAWGEEAAALQAVVEAEAGLSRLHLAAALGRTGEVKALLAVGADKNAAGPHGRTPLHVAVRCGQVGAARALLQAGCDMGARDDSGLTARTLALRRGHTELVGLLDEAFTQRHGYRP